MNTATYSEGPFCPVVFSLGTDGLHVYTYRAQRHRVDSKCVYVNTIVTVEDNRDFNARFVRTADINRYGA